MIAFDIDGTLSIVGDRLDCLQNQHYDSFYERCGEDRVNWDLAEVYKSLHMSNIDIIVVTGRRESCRHSTLKWFRENGLYLESKNLYMRDDGDTRRDTVVKLEKVEHIIDSITLVFEDRNCMVKVWRDRGVTCCQVAEGNF